MNTIFNNKKLLAVILSNGSIKALEKLTKHKEVKVQELGHAFDAMAKALTILKTAVQGEPVSDGVVDYKKGQRKPEEFGRIKPLKKMFGDSGYGKIKSMLHQLDPGKLNKIADSVPETTTKETRRALRARVRQQASHILVTSLMVRASVLQHNEKGADENC